MPLYLIGLEKKTNIKMFDDDFQILGGDVDMELHSFFGISKYKISDKTVLDGYAERILLASDAFQSAGNYDEACNIYNKSK